MRLTSQRRLVLGTGLGSLAQLSNVGLLLTSGWLIVRAAEQPPVLYLIVAVTSVRMFGVARAALRYAERLLTHDAALARSVDERARAYRALAHVGPVGVAGKRHGEVVRTVVQDVESVQDGLLRLRLPWVGALVATAVTSAAVALVLPAAGAVLLGGAVLVLATLRVVVPRVARHTAPGSLTADVTELVRAAPDLVAFGAARGRVERAHVEVDALAAADRRLAWAGGLGTAVVALGCAMATAGVVAASASAGLTGPLVGVLLLAPLGLADVLEAVADAERHRPRVRAARGRLHALAAQRPRLPEPDAPREPAGADLELRDVTIGWDHDLATGLDVVVPEGSRLVVTGPSGGGKSTLAATLSRLVPARSGRVLLGGVDVADVPTATVRSLVGWMPQDAPVFDTTLRENLRVADPSASEADLWCALRRVRLAATVESWSDGLDTRVGEGGRSLSGGERQRVALARMLVAGHRVLVLDEPTEHLDAPTAHALLDVVDALAPDHTVVVVSHAPDVVARFERRLRVGPRSADSHDVMGIVTSHGKQPVQDDDSRARAAGSHDVMGTSSTGRLT